MNTMDTIFNRKSVRTYTGEPISEAELQLVLKAANASPVGLKQYETLHLTIVSNKQLLTAIDRTAAEFMQKPEAMPLYGAPSFILVSSVIAPGRENVAYSNAAIIVQNMALAAADIGIGACHIWGAVAALNKHPELVAQLELPEGFTPCCGIVLGKTEEIYEVREVPMDRIALNCVE